MSQNAQNQKLRGFHTFLGSSHEKLKKNIEIMNKYWLEQKIQDQNHYSLEFELQSSNKDNNHNGIKLSLHINVAALQDEAKQLLTGFFLMIDFNFVTVTSATWDETAMLRRALAVDW